MGWMLINLTLAVASSHAQQTTVTVTDPPKAGVALAHTTAKLSVVVAVAIARAAE
jgi:hypothetical protein